MIARALVLAFAAVLALASAPAFATTGFGCYRANTDPSDPLAIRSAPRASSAEVGSVSWNSQGIIALTAPQLRGEGVQPDLFDVWLAEFDVCVPGDLPVGARWCPIAVYDGDTTLTGWIKRRFVDYAECP